MTTTSVLRYTALLLALVLLSCNWEGDLSLVGEEETALDAQERERVRRMLAIRVLNNTTGEFEEVAAADLVEKLSFICEDRVREAEPACPLWNESPSGTCADHTCDALRMVCMAHQLAAMTTLRTETYDIAVDGVDWSIPSQSTATNFDIIRRAVSRAEFAILHSLDLLRHAVLRPTMREPVPGFYECPATALDDPFGPAPRTVGTALVATLLEAYYLYRELLDNYVDLGMALSDAELGSHPSLHRAAARAYSGATLSRSAIAHSLVGGAAGLLGDTQSPLCDTPSHTPQMAAAISVLREAAIPPAYVLESTSVLSTEQLLAGDLTDGSVRQRLGEVWNHEGLGDTPTASAAAAYFGLNISDFEAARRYLSLELAAFKRSQTATLPPRVLVGGATSSYDRYAATATQPDSPPIGMYAALARHRETPEPQTDVFMQGGIQNLLLVRSDPQQANSAATNFIDGVFGHVADVLNFSVLIPAAVRQAMTDQLALLAAEGARTRTGRFEVWLDRTEVDPNDLRLYFYIDSAAPLHAPRVVLGEEGLRCAVDGHIDGAPCDLAALTIDELSDEMSSYTGFTTTYANPGDGAVSSTSGLSNFSRLYLIDKRSAAAVGSAGDWVPLAGATVVHPAIGTAGSTVVAIVPELEQRVHHLLMPSSENCTRPQVNCAGETYDGRLPLEDELTDDGDPYESSWRHYLILAEQAARESDLRAEELFAAQLEFNVRAEDAVANLQDLCGASIDPVGLLPEDLSATYDGTPCTSDAQCAGTGMRCVARRCTLDPVALAEATTDIPARNRIAECLGSGTVIPYVALGNHALCMWRRADDPNRICEQAPSGEPPSGEPRACPVIARGAIPAGDDPTYVGAACPDLSPPSIPGVTLQPILVRRQLEYFDLNENPPPRPNEPPCAAFRRLRNATTFGDTERGDLMSVIASDFFRFLNVQQIARQLSWEARVGGFSAIVQGGRPWYATGSTALGATTNRWPCASAGVVGCAAPMQPEDALLCATISCANPDDRARMNIRLLRAVIGAQLIGELEAPANHFTDNIGGLAGAESFSFRHTIPVQFSRDTGSFFTATRLRATTAIQETWESILYRTSPIPYEWRTTDGSGVGGPTHNYIAAEYAWGVGTWPAPPSSRLIGWYSPNSHAATAPVSSFFADFAREENPAEASVLVLIDQPLIQIDFDPRNPSAAWREYFGRTVLTGLSTTPDTSGDAAVWPTNWPVGLGWAIQRLQGGHPTFPHASWNDSPAVWWGPSFVDAPPLDYVNAHQVLLPPLTIDDQMLLDGLELVCEAGSSTRPPCNPDSVPAVSSVADLENASHYLECVASSIGRRGGLTVLANLPERAVDALRSESSVGAYPALGGKIAEATTQLRAGLLEIQQVSWLASQAVADLAVDMRNLRIQLALHEVRNEILDVQFYSTVVEQMSQCVLESNSGSIGRGIAGCLNSLAQISFAEHLHGLSEQELELTGQLAVNGFHERFRERSATLNGLSDRLLRASEEIDGALAEMELLRSQAQRALTRALFLDSSHGAVQFGAGADYRRRLNTRRIRFDEAHRNAVRMAFLAKRAIEQRLGMRLSDMTDDLPLVAAPSTWESTICTTTGADPSRLMTDPTTPHYADAFIGDYVRRLENVVESYRLVHGFNDGTDTAVVSMRDDVQNVRAGCQAPVANLLYHSGNLAARSTNELPGWDPWGCGTEIIDGVEYDIPNCAWAVALSEEGSTGPFPPDHPELSAVRGHRLTFGMEDGSPCESTSTTCGLRSQTRFGQRDIGVAPGRYRISWYGRTVGVGGPNPQTAVSVVNDVGVELAASPRFSTGGGGGSVWTRYFFVFDVPVGGSDVTIQVTPNIATPMPSQSLELAAFMVEDVGASITGALASVTTADGPRVYANTTADRTAWLPVCEDTTGEVFRERNWRRECVRLCADGYRRDCTGEAGQTYCYWETSFNINQRDIESGRSFLMSSFARGNYNYRFGDIAVNFVGTGIRNCDQEPLSSSCYGAGFVPYTLIHNGPYYIRNHRGNDFLAELFPGRIEHARGLASERYVTNPLSSADRSLIQPYVRSEWRGRPLDGNFVLRVWEEPGVDFTKIEDVQLVIDYRYWTRSE